MSKELGDAETKGPIINDAASIENGRTDHREQDFMTRNGLNMESFKRRNPEDGIVKLDQSMKPRHLNMISIGGSIGAGFFVGSGSALTRGGPAAVLLCFSICGVMIFNVVHALGELAVMYPVSGGFYTYSTRFIDPTWGFAMGWNYVFQWLIVLPFELGVSSVYGSSRTITALAEQNYAPKIFTYIDKSGRPLVSVVFTLVFGALAYVSLASGGMVVFDWLLSLSAMSSLITWGSICACHIRFRAAWTRQGRSMDLIPYKAFGGVWGSWIGLILCFIILAAQFYTAATPAGGVPNSVERILQNILTIPVVAVFWVIGFVWKRSAWVPMDKVDLDTGLRQHNWDEINAYRAKINAYPAWKRFIHNLFA